jgi:hypothetical protein
MCVTCLAHHIFDFITGMIFVNEYKSWKFLIIQFSPVTTSLLGVNILLSFLFHNTISLCLSVSMRPIFTPLDKWVGETVVMF